MIQVFNNTGLQRQLQLRFDSPIPFGVHFRDIESTNQPAIMSTESYTGFECIRLLQIEVKRRSRTPIVEAAGTCSSTFRLGRSVKDLKHP